MLLKVQFKILCYMVVYLGLGKKKKRKMPGFGNNPLKLPSGLTLAEVKTQA